MRTLSLAVLFVVGSVVHARADTVYGPDQHPLAVRNFCVHWVTPAQLFVASDSTGQRKYNVTFSQLGVSLHRSGPLRLPVLAIGLAEADQSQERLLNKLTLLGSVGFALRTGDWDNGRFEPQWVFAYTRDFRSKRSGLTIGFAIGF